MAHLQDSVDTVARAHTVTEGVTARLNPDDTMAEVPGSARIESLDCLPHVAQRVGTRFSQSAARAIISA